MKLKLDENGNVVVVDGKPVYVHDDGKEIPFDAPAAMTKIGVLNNEAATHRHAAKEANEKLAAFADMDPVAAREALKTVQDYSDKKLVDAGEVDTLKKQLGETFEKERTTLKGTIDAKDKQIRKLTVSARFSASEFIRGKTVLTPDIAEAAFGSHFDVEESEGAIRVVAKLNGNPIFSREKPGEYASFDEAIASIIDSRADKGSILRSSSNSGSGAGGGQGGLNGEDNPFKTGNRTEQAALIRSNRDAAKSMAIQAGVEVPGLTT